MTYAVKHVAGGGALIAHGAGGRELDLHQAEIALGDHARIAAAFALDDTAHQVFRQIIGSGVPGDQAVEIAVGVEPGHALVFCGSDRGRGGERNQKSCNAYFANHVVSGFFGMPCFSLGTPATLWPNWLKFRGFHHELSRAVTGRADENNKMRSASCARRKRRRWAASPLNERIALVRGEGPQLGFREYIEHRRDDGADTGEPGPNVRGYGAVA